MNNMHVHNHGCLATAADRDIKVMSRVTTIVFLFMLLELWGHCKSSSLSLLADCIHLLVDFLGFLSSILALAYSTKKEDERMGFGYSRVEILGALISIFLIWAATGYLIIESYHKLIHPHEINTHIFLSISLIGLFVNIYCMFELRDKRVDTSENRNLNMRAAYIHVIGDLIQSVGVVMASIITFINPKWILVDILTTLCFSCIVLCSTYFVTKDAVNILLEKKPSNINYDKIRKHIMNINGTITVTRIRSWRISANVMAINLHVMIANVVEYERILRQIVEYLHDFEYVTVQLETENTIGFCNEKLCLV